MVFPTVNNQILFNMKKFLFNQFSIILLCLFMAPRANAQDHPHFYFNAKGSVLDEKLIKTMERNVEAVFSVINTAYNRNDSILNISPSNATSDAIKRIKALWGTSHFRCTEMNNIISRVLTRGDDVYQIRNIPVFFASGSSPEDQYQDIVIDFNLDGKICDLYEAIEDIQYQKIFENSESVTDYRYRQMVADFVESFRSAYNRKDLPYLKAVFSEDALIITGTVIGLQRNPDIENGVTYSPKISYSVQSKDEYITRLENNIFKNNKVIDIKFKIQSINKHKDKPIYGVLIKQDWNSSTYNDKGWLFLIIDYGDINAPCIHVRTWQPLDTPQDSIFGLDSPEFRIY